MIFALPVVGRWRICWFRSKSLTIEITLPSLSLNHLNYSVSMLRWVCKRFLRDTPSIHTHHSSCLGAERSDGKSVGARFIAPAGWGRAAHATPPPFAPTLPFWARSHISQHKDLGDNETSKPALIAIHAQIVRTPFSDLAKAMDSEERPATKSSLPALPLTRHDMPRASLH